MIPSKTKRRRVAMITGTRAEFGALESVLRAMQKHTRLDPKLIVTGMHLLPKFGRTIDQIRHAGWRIDATVRMQTGRDEPSAEALAVARGVAGIAKAVARLDCDIVVVLGDRIEAFAGAAAAACGRRVLAHIHGGDRALGDVDDALRNAITRLAHVHLVASKDASDRLRQMGEATWRIHRVGAPGLDDIRRCRQAERTERRRSNRRLREILGPIADTPFAVVVHHPRGRSARLEAATCRQIVAAVEQCDLAGAIIFPNSDPGHQGIIDVLTGLKRRPRWRIFRSLPREDYLRLMSRSAVLVGNSSSGIIESASLGVNAVNIGPRQSGRLRCGTNVIEAAETKQAVVKAIRQALKRPRPAARRSVYGDGRAGQRIADILARLKSTSHLLQKELTY